jgi:hypothetical protein
MQPRVTVKKMAAMAGVSERLMYLSLKLKRYGTPELTADVQAGKLSVNAALRQLGLMDKPSRLKQAKALWPKLTPAEQRALWHWINDGN